VGDATKIKVAVSGALGRMGQATCEAVRQDDGLVLAAVVDPGFADALESGSAGPTAGAERFATLDDALATGGIDVVVDFTTPAVVRDNVLLSIRRLTPMVVGTTGLSESDMAEVAEQALEHGVPVLVAPNFAMGAVLMMQFAREAARNMKACEIVELHHEGKLDAPSGTSKLTRSLIEKSWRGLGLDREVPIHSVRLPGLVAHQEVIFGGLGETLTIRHDSLSRESFMPGVIMAVKRVCTLQGLVVGLENIL